MQLAIDEMKKSVAEPRNDKTSPKVGAVLVSSDGEIFGSSHRGEMRNGDHAEFTLLERKFRDRNLTDYYLFATLEPCAPGSRKHPKLGCAERIVNARIKKVWVGVEDPDPTVDRKGIKYLQDCGIEVEMFDEDFQEMIYRENEQFMKEAKQRSHNAKKPKIVQLTALENSVIGSSIDEFSQEALTHYIKRANLRMQPDSSEFLNLLEQQQLIQFEASSNTISLDETRRNDVLPIFKYARGNSGKGVRIDTFENHGERATIISFSELEDNKSGIKVPLGLVDKNDQWNLFAKSKTDEVSSNLLGYHFEIFFHDKDKRNYRQEFFRSGTRSPIISEPALINHPIGTYNPTGLGILLFGKNPRNRYPQAVLKVEARFGSGDPEIHDFSDALVLIPDKVEEWLKRVLSSKISRDNFARETEYSYPIVVLREAIINALVHRDYDIEGAKCYLNIEDDQIVVKSPGLPVSPIKFEDFKQFKAPSLSRNPKIMAVFNEMHYAEERGIGMREMKSLPIKHNLPLPNITWEEPFINIIFPRSQNFLESLIGRDTFNKLNEEEKSGLVFIYDQKEVSRSQYAARFKYNDKKAQRHLAFFVKLTAVVMKGKGPSTKYVFNKA